MLQTRRLFSALSLLLCFTSVSANAVIADTHPLPSSELKAGVETFFIDCPGNPQQTTIDGDDCMKTKRAEVEAIEDKYVNAARQRIAADTDSPQGHVVKTLNAFDAENAAWDALINKASTATRTDWEGGSIRGIMGTDREIKLIEIRVHNQWENWLTHMDSTPAILPEPKFNNVE